MLKGLRLAAVGLGFVVATVAPAFAQGTLRIGMTAADIPQTTGQPDQGFEGFRFAGYTIYDALVNWDLSKSDVLADIKPGLAIEWAPVPGDPLAYPIHGEQAGSPPTLLVTASLDPLRDQGRRYAAALAVAGVECHFMEMKGTIHGFVNLRKAVPSAQGDLLAILAQAKLMLGRISA